MIEHIFFVRSKAYFNNPFYTARKVSLRVRNFESGRLKVNELNGSPIEIASVIVDVLLREWMTGAEIVIDGGQLLGTAEK